MAQSFQLVASALLVVSLMLAAGLQLRPRDLFVLGAHPRLLIGAVVVNIVVIPGLTLALLQALALPTAIVIGLMLSIATPGGPAAVLYVGAARPRAGWAPPARALDEVAMAVSLTIVLPFIGVLSTPLTLSLVPDLPPDLSVPVWPVVRSLVVLQALPLVAGMAVLAKAPDFAARLQRVARTIGNLTLAGMTLTLLILKGAVLANTPAVAVVAMAIIVAATPVIGYLAALPDRHTARAGAIVALSRSSSVAIMLSSTFFKDPVIDATVLTFALLVVVAPLVMAQVWRRRPT